MGGSAAAAALSARQVYNPFQLFSGIEILPPGARGSDGGSGNGAAAGGAAAGQQQRGAPEAGVGHLAAPGLHSAFGLSVESPTAAAEAGGGGRRLGGQAGASGYSSSTAPGPALNGKAGASGMGGVGALASANGLAAAAAVMQRRRSSASASDDPEEAAAHLLAGGGGGGGMEEAPVEQRLSKRLAAAEAERTAALAAVGRWSAGLREALACPLTGAPMQQPVVAADGYTYEAAAIAEWLTTSRASPVTGEQLAHGQLVPNRALQRVLLLVGAKASPAAAAALGR
jgi:hypothetical protein